MRQRQLQREAEYRLQLEEKFKREEEERLWKARWGKSDAGEVAP